ncbi:diguanylate cyclase [Pseudomonas sp. FFUP_PS_41]|nr:diguanylate cyclase [Pseudomonas sp. FFUP_PS_41]
MGAGAPANTGVAGAIHRVACFAGTPAPTGDRASFGRVGHTVIPLR